MNRNSFKWYREIYGTKYKNNVFSDGNIKPTITYNNPETSGPTNIRYNENYRIIDHINGLGQVSYNFPCLTNTVHIHFKMYTEIILANNNHKSLQFLYYTSTGWCIAMSFQYPSSSLTLFTWHATKTGFDKTFNYYSYLYYLHTYDMLVNSNILSLYIDNVFIGSLDISSINVGNIVSVVLPNCNTISVSSYMNAYVYLQDVFIDNTGSYYYTPDEYYLQRELTPYEIMENNDISYGNI